MHATAFVPTWPWLFPFALLLASIAILPLAASHFWESNLRKLGIALVLALPVFLLYVQNDPTALGHTAEEYVAFIVLLGSLFVISGGVLLTGDIEATPRVNTLFIAAGALLASFVGTTGASMLLIRPLLSTNKERRHVVHTVVFFIFCVSNIGGCLTPLGDPPLFLGFLRGVPFLWTLRLAPAWLLTNGILLLIYFLWDRAAVARETRQDRLRDRLEVRPLRMAGGRNLLLLLGILGCVAWLPFPTREGAMIALSVVSLLITPKGLRAANHFTFHPIIEVAALFSGIFITMLPALAFLQAHAAAIGVRQPWHFFWATGTLSSFLDNAPTYLTFLALAQGLGLTPEVVGVTHRVLEGISLGAVFMGSMTYIGNGPNFMVKAIAEERGIRMPSFGGYVVYSAAVLLPLFVLVTAIFLL
jgi:Na+/H+ antiporter NhaD/arsenite permease-like protein